MVTEQELRTALSCFVEYPVFCRGPFDYKTSTSTTTDHKPSIREAYDSFIGLPADHPLHRDFDETQVRAGYELLRKQRVVSRSVESLHRVICA